MATLELRQILHRWPYILSTVLAALMVVQSVLGRTFPGQYRDVEWIRATWFGNDWVTLVVGVPLLVASLVLARRGSIRGLLLQIFNGLAEAPGELPLWGALAVTTTAVTALLLANAQDRRERRP